MNQNNNIWTNTKCHKCGKTNIGWQTNCLFCGVELNSLHFQKDTMLKCPSCDVTVKENQKFCTSCGNKIPENMKASNISAKLPENLEPVIDDTPEVKKCLSCDTELKPGAKFCTKCGTKV